VADDAEVVADEEVGEAELGLQVLEQVDDLRLDRDVEGRDGLVADDELGPQGQGPGDADALALAAGELVREALGAPRGARPTTSQELGAPSSRLARVDAVDGQGSAMMSCRSCAG
jgi:hypothetical protein